MTPTQIQQWARESKLSREIWMTADCLVSLETFAHLARADSERMTEQVIAGADLARADLEAENERLNDDVTMHMRVAVKAIDECVELKAENEKLRNHIKHIGNDAMRGENASLKAEVESLRADAERYRWLRGSDAEHAQVMTYIEGLDEWLAYSTAEDIDAAVDQKRGEA